MKRIIYLVLVAMVVTVAWSTATTAQEWSKPILVGGDTMGTGPSAAEKEVNQTTDVTEFKWFAHPKVESSNVNFLQPTLPITIIEPSDYDPVYMRDFAATPAKRSGAGVTATSEMIDNAGSRGVMPGIPDLSGVGTDDLEITIGGIILAIGTDFQLFGSNRESCRLLLGDIRVDEADEWDSLFLDPPLLSLTFPSGDHTIIGDASDKHPPYHGEYPATVINEGDAAMENFQWHAALFKCDNPWRGYNNTFSICNHKLGGGLEYEDIFLYDFADVGTGIVAPSYDPFNLQLKGELVQGAKLSPLAGPITGGWTSPWPVEFHGYGYHSPLTLFRKLFAGGDKWRYRFSGYTSYYLPDIDFGGTGIFNVFPDLWQFVLTNWFVPVATNPIAIEALDLGGASTAVIKDSDVAVSYQTTFFSLDKEIFGATGRPVMAGDIGYVKHRDVIGTCADPTCATFYPLQNTDPDSPNRDYFPDDILSFLLYWNQNDKWATGDEPSPYHQVNASHVFRPKGKYNDALPGIGGAITGPGVYDTAVLTDFEGTPSRKQRVIVPSTAVVTLPNTHPMQPCTDCSPFYVVRTDGEPNLHFKVPTAYLDFGTTPYPVSGWTCTEKLQYVSSPLIKPEMIFLPRPPSVGLDGFVPYKVRAVNLDMEPGDKNCMDGIVTWRGAKTKKDTTNPGKVIFDDGAGNMFSNRVTIVRRIYKAATNSCETQLPQQHPAGYDYIGTTVIPTHIDVIDGTTGSPAIVASADVGDFDGDGYNDIVAGNLRSENDTAYAYVYWGMPQSGVPFTTSPDSRVRTGFKEGSAVTDGAGVVRSDHNGYGPDAIGAINGRPLILPEIGCRDYDDPDDPRVQSVYETYVSLFKNVISQWAQSTYPAVYNIKRPFVDSGQRPVPERCAKPLEKCNAGGYDLPLYQDDACCAPRDCLSMTYSAWGPTDCGKLLHLHSWISCDVFNYIKDYATECYSSTAPYDIDMLNEGIAGADDRGGGDGGGTDFASWQPDRVLEDDYGAIVHAAALRNAQSSPGATYDTTVDEDLVGDVKADVNVAKRSPAYYLQNASSPDFGLPLGNAIVKLLEMAAKENPQFAEQVAKLRESGDLEKFNTTFNEFATAELMGTGSGFFTSDILTAAMATEIYASSSLSGEGEESNRSSPRCSLVADVPAFDWSKVADKIKAAASWIWDLIVPDAGAATCGPDTVCLLGVPGGCAPDEMCLFDGVATYSCSITPSCGDGCILPLAAEQCDPKADHYSQMPAHVNYDDTGPYNGCPSTHPTCSAADCMCRNGSVTIPTSPPPNGYIDNVNEICDDLPDWGFIIKGPNNQPGGATNHHPMSKCYWNKMVCVEVAGGVGLVECRTPYCGDNVWQSEVWRDGTIYHEDCDASDPDSPVCAVGACTACKCPFNLGVSLPRGQLMPGHRETTAVVQMTPKGTSLSLCSPPNGAKDPGEQCDLHGWLPGLAYDAELDTQCSGVIPAGETLIDCNINCLCVSINPACVANPTAECTSTAQCQAIYGASSTCDVECNCTGAPVITPQPAITSTVNDCFVYGLSYSSEETKEYYKKFNKDMVQPLTGRPDELFVEIGQRFAMVCRFGGGSVMKEADLSLVSGDIVSGELYGAYGVWQLKGSILDNRDLKEYMAPQALVSPMRILPVEPMAAQTIKAMVLPNLSMSPQYAGFDAAPQLAVTSVASGLTGTTQVNNMIEHRIFSLAPGQEYTIEVGGLAQTVKAQAVDIPEHTAITVHETIILADWDYAPMTGVSGFVVPEGMEESDLYAENRQWDWDAIKAAIAANISESGGVPNSSYAADLPIKQALANRYYGFMFAQSPLVKAGDPELSTMELEAYVLAGPADMSAMGSGCSCYIADGNVTLGSIAPFVLVMLVPVGGIAVGAIRRRRRK